MVCIGFSERHPTRIPFTTGPLLDAVILTGTMKGGKMEP